MAGQSLPDLLEKPTASGISPYESLDFHYRWRYWSLLGAVPVLLLMLYYPLVVGLFHPRVRILKSKLWSDVPDRLRQWHDVPYWCAGSTFVIFSLGYAVLLPHFGGVDFSLWMTYSVAFALMDFVGTSVKISSWFPYLGHGSVTVQLYRLRQEHDKWIWVSTLVTALLVAVTVPGVFASLSEPDRGQSGGPEVYAFATYAGVILLVEVYLRIYTHLTVIGAKIESLADKGDN